jgi:hypothetical protein
LIIIPSSQVLIVNKWTHSLTVTASKRVFGLNRAEIRLKHELWPPHR